MTVTLKIEKNVYGGDGLGRMGSGRVAFVPGAFAGETVRAEILAEKKNYVTTRLVEIESPSPDRVKDVGNVVPGMVYAPVSYAGELRLKQDQLENFLWKVAPTVLPLEVVPSPQPLNYRNKVVYHTEKRQGKWLLGYRAEPEHRVVDVTEDPLACPAINAALPGIRSSVFALLTRGARAVRESAKSADNVTIRWTPLDGVKWWLGEPPRDLELREQADGRRFRVSADGFWQVNTAIGDKLVMAVRAAYDEASDRAPHILDLYCGVGVFGLSCVASNAGQRSGTLASPNHAQGRLIGIESGRSAVAAAKRNAEAMGVKASFFCERVGGSLSRIKVGPQHTVIVDPPRGGLEPNVAPWLANRPAPRIIYVSCDPATLVRDLAALVKSYEIKYVKLLDMFPRTARFETMVVLDRKNP